MAEPKFVPKPGQVDYTNIRYAPVINVVVVHKGKVLMVRRSDDLRFYPGYWHCVAGFLDDSQSIEEKVREELREEIDLGDDQIISMQRGQIVLSEAPDYGKTYLIVPVLVQAASAEVRLDWEASRAEWLVPAEARQRKLVPGLAEVFNQFFP